MKYINQSLFIILIICITVASAKSQMYLQLEVFNSTTTKKYAPGSKLVYKTKEFPKGWTRANIETINYEDQFVMMDNGQILFVDDITEIRTFNIVPALLAKGMYVFVAQSLVFGIIDVIREKTITWQFGVYTVGGTALGIFFDKIAYKKYRMGKNARVRLLDLRMF